MQVEDALGSGLLHLGVEVDVVPGAVLTLVLHLAGDEVPARLDAERAGHVHEEHIPRTGEGTAVLEDADRALGDLPDSGIVDDLDIVFGPLDERGGILQGRLFLCRKILQEELLVGHQELVGNALKDNGFRGIVGIFQDLRGDVVQVLAAQAAEDFAGPLVGMVRKELPYHLVIAHRAHQEGIALLHESVHVGVPERIFIGKTPVVGSPLLRSDLGEHHVFWRRHDVDSLRFDGMTGGELQRHLLIFTERHFAVAVKAVLLGPSQHVPETCAEEGPALGIGVFAERRIELGVIVDHEPNPGPCGRSAVRTEHLDVHLRRFGVVVYEVDFGVVGAFQHRLFRAFVTAEYLGVHEHGAGSWGVEPAQVEHRLGLAGPQEPPFAVRPGLYPGMVVVGMRPARGVHLAGRDAH